MSDYLAQVELEAEFNARYDYLSEAHGATARDCNAMAQEDVKWYEEEDNIERQDDIEARGGPMLPVVLDDPF